MANGTPFSDFVDGGLVRITDITVGLRDGANTQFTNFGIADEMGAPILTFTEGNIPNVNYTNFENALTGDNPNFEVLGSDTNIGFTAIMKGTGKFVITASSSLTMPSGTTSERPTVVVGGDLRYSETTGLMEYYDGLTASWDSLAPSSGTISSVVGTANRITVNTVATVATINIAATYVGQTSITTLGTITTGVWQGTPVALAFGGTNAALTANTGGIFYSTATAGAILAGTATARQMLQSGATAAPTWSTTTWPATSTINQILYSSAANVIAGLATANQAVLTTGATGIPVLTALATNGQLIIGSTAGVPAAATITAGAGISVTNGANSITIATTSAGFTWTDATNATYTLVAENGYVTNRGGGVTYTLPATAAVGDTIQIVGKLGLFTIAQNANQQIVAASQNTTIGVGGSLVATNVGDCVELICITAGASCVFRVAAGIGNWTYN